MNTRTIVAAAALALLVTGCGADPVITEMEQESKPKESAPEKPQGLRGEAVLGDVTVSLSGVERATSSAYASPASAPYAAFTVKVTNGSDAPVSADEFYVSCTYGPDGVAGEPVFDSDEGIDILPSATIRPGKAVSARMGCEMPTDEAELQIEVTRGIDAPAVFAGTLD